MDQTSAELALVTCAGDSAASRGPHQQTGFAHPPKVITPHVLSM